MGWACALVELKDVSGSRLGTFDVEVLGFVGFMLLLTLGLGHAKRGLGWQAFWGMLATQGFAVWNPFCQEGGGDGVGEEGES